MDLSSDEQLEEDPIRSQSLNPCSRYSSMSIEPSRSEPNKAKQSNRICQRELTELIVEAIQAEQSQTINKILKRTQSCKRFSEGVNSGSLKRRVYDCINVMVAAGVINKNNTKVSFNNNSGFIKRQERKTIQDKLFISRMNCIEKQARISQMRSHYKIFANIFNKNKAKDLSHDEQVKIRPPFCGIITNTNDTFKMESKPDCIILTSSTQFIPYGDTQIFMMPRDETQD